MGEGLEELWRDLAVFTNLSTGTKSSAGEPTEEQPLSWVMVTGRPVTRYVASDAMQSEMQSSLILGSVFVFFTLSFGFRSFKQASVTLIPILLVVVWLYGLMYAAGSSLNIVTGLLQLSRLELVSIIVSMLLKGIVKAEKKVSLTMRLWLLSVAHAV